MFASTSMHAQLIATKQHSKYRCDFNTHTYTHKHLGAFTGDNALA